MKLRVLWLLWLGLLVAAPLARAVVPQVPAFAASFVQTRTLPGFDAPLISHGNMRFGADQGFRWEITKPYHYVFEMRDGQAHEQLPDGTTRTLKPEQTPWLAAVQHIFVSALSGDQSQLARYFQVDSKPLAGGGRQVTLTPRSAAMGEAIRRIEVTESAPGQPQHLVIQERSGGRMEMRFTPLPAVDGD